MTFSNELISDNKCDYSDYECDRDESKESNGSEESDYSEYEYVFNPLAKEFIPLTKELNPSAKEFIPLAKEFVPFDPFEYSDLEDTEVTIKHPGFTMGVKKTYGAKIGKITCEGLVFDIINYENNVAILTIPNRVYDAFFPLTMSILQVVQYYFGNKRITADDSIYMPMNEAPFCNIIVE